MKLNNNNNNKVPQIKPKITSKKNPKVNDHFSFCFNKKISKFLLFLKFFIY
jgi:hypothetical protein